jgi:hypothetical protein
MTVVFYPALVIGEYGPVDVVRRIAEATDERLGGRRG